MELRKIFLILAYLPFIGILAGCSPTIQKSINVTRQISSPKKGNSLYSYNPFSQRWGHQNEVSLIRSCRDISITERQFNKLLEKGAQIITNYYFEQTVEYVQLAPKVNTDPDGELKTYTTRGSCIGETFIIKARKSLINTYVTY